MVQVEAYAFAGTIVDSCDAMHNVAAQQGHHKQQSMAATHEQLWCPLLHWTAESHVKLCNC